MKQLACDTIASDFMKNVIIVILAVLVVAGSAAGFYGGQLYAYVPPVKGVTNLDVGQPGDVDFSLFWDAWRVVQEDYASEEPLDFQAMVHGAIGGMVSSLGDPYTTFMVPEDTRTFLEDISGSFSGVGMEIGVREERLQVIAPLEGTPAERAGLRAGDYITKIDEEIVTADLTVDKAVALIRGPEGTEVVLSIFREGWEEPRDFVIERAVINVPSLRSEVIDGVAYVKIFQFSEQLRDDFRKLDGDLFRKSDKIVIDVRNNPGGFLHVAVDIAGWFLQRGDVVVIEDFGPNEEPEEHKARGNARLYDHEVVILMNKGSASASEILAGALRDNRGVLLIGEKSFGKGSVQELKDLKDDSSIKVTIAKWLTPKGNLIQGEGLEPDIVIEFTEEDFEEDRDPQLDQAIEVLNSL